MKKFSQEESGRRGNRHQEEKKLNKEKKRDVGQSFQIRAETLQSFRGSEGGLENFWSVDFVLEFVGTWSKIEVTRVAEWPDPQELLWDMSSRHF